MKLLKYLCVSVVFLLFISSCQEKGKQKVTIGMVTFPGYAPLYIAKEKGFFDDVDVELRRIEAIGDLRSAIKSGKIDAYAATYDIFQAVKGTKPPGVGFLAIDQSHGGDGVVVAEGINSIKDFKGKTVGAEPGFPPFFVLQYILHEKSMSLDDVAFKDMASQDAGNAFVAGQLDIAGTYEPYLSISAEKRDGSKILYSSKDLPGLIVDWLFADEDFLENNPEALKAVAMGWFKAVDLIKSNPDEAYKIMARAFNVDKQEMIDFKSGISWLTIEDNKQMLDKSNPNNAYVTFDKVGNVLESNNETDVRVKAEDKLTIEIIKMIE